MASDFSLNRRHTLKVGLGAAAASALGPLTFRNSVRAADPVKLINVEHDSRPLDNAAYAAVYKSFQTKHPEDEIDFQVIPWEQARPKLLTLSQGNELPDMGRIAWVADFAAADMILPIESRVQSASLERFDPILIEGASSIGLDGEKHLYAIPWFAGTHSILVNKTLLEAAGLPLKDEWTTDEFTEYCKTLTESGKQWGVAMDGSGVGDPVQIFLMAAYAYGGKWVQGDTQSTEPEPIVFNSAETAAGIKWFTNIYLNGYAVPSAPSDTYKERDVNFQSGKAVIEWQGPWSLLETKENFKQGGWELASMPLPKGPAGAIPSALGGGMEGLFRGAKIHGVEAEAFAWVDYLSSDEGQILYCKTNGMIPASKKAQADPFWANDPLYKGYLGTMASTKVMLPIWATGIESMLDDIVPPLLQGIMLGKLKPEEAADQIQSEVIRGLQQNGVDVPKS